MGRVVRSPDDYGVRILMDARFQKSSVGKLGKYSIFESFPEEERAEFVDIPPAQLEEKLSLFFEEMKSD
jgi:DNA excision repair protein ERCC-2